MGAGDPLRGGRWDWSPFLTLCVPQKPDPFLVRPSVLLPHWPPVATYTGKMGLESPFEEALLDGQVRLEPSPHLYPLKSQATLVGGGSPVLLPNWSPITKFRLKMRLETPFLLDGQVGLEPLPHVVSNPTLMLGGSPSLLL